MDNQAGSIIIVFGYVDFRHEQIILNASKSVQRCAACLICFSY